MNQEINIKRIILLALMIALSTVGAYIIIPSPIGTVAFDSAPGYLASLLFAGVSGSIVLFLGHLFSAMKNGFPLGMLHLGIAVLMGVCGLVFAYLYNKVNSLLGVIVVIILNGIVLDAVLIPFLGYPFFLSMLIPLLLGSAVNVVLAVVIHKILGKRINLEKLRNQGSYHEKK